MMKLIPPRKASFAVLATGIILIHCLLAFDPAAAAERRSLKWTVRALTVDGNEGIDVADFNRDGKLDVIAGRNWYAAPDFVARPVRTIEDWNGYVESNGDYALDVNGDGWMDVIAGSFLPTAVQQETTSYKDLVGGDPNPANEMLGLRERSGYPVGLKCPPVPGRFETLRPPRRRSPRP